VRRIGDLFARAWRGRLVIAALTALAWSATPATGQDWGSPADGARMQVGPVALTPTISLTRIGIDPNVFNDESNPKSDFSATLQPAANAWVRLGRNWLTINSQVSYTHFQEFADQRSLNTNQRVRLDVPFNRVRLFVGGGYANLKERPGLDIDLRARRAVGAQSAGADFRIATKTTLQVSAERTTERFVPNALSSGIDLASTLNRDTNTVSLDLGQTLTPFTTVVLRGAVQQVRFVDDSSHDNTSQQVTAGFTFNQLALVRGQLSVGLLNIQPLGNSIAPGFLGYAADVNVSYMFRSSTQFGLRLQRSINYSSDPLVSYFVLTDLTGTFEHRFNPRWDVVGSVNRASFAYDPTVALTNRVRAISAGVGCWIQPAFRVGVQFGVFERDAAPDSRVADYRAASITSSVTHAF
jgi:hypothetical protein